MQAMNTARRPGRWRWLLYGYVVLSAAALIWLTTVVRQQQSRLLADRQHQAQMVANTLLGVVQNLEAVPGVLSPEGNPQVSFPLENAESSIAQVSLATFGYSKIVGQSLPHDALLPQAPLLRLVMPQERGRDGQLSLAEVARLRALAVDLRTLWEVYPVDLLARAQPAELAAARVRLAQQVKDPAAQKWLQEHP